jgi:ABC-type transporter Mla subunit MlaD
MRATIAAWVMKLTKGSRITCRGSTSGKNVTAFDKRLAVIEENSQKTTDYTRDIKNDIKQDLRRLEVVVEQVERTSKQAQRESETEVRQLRKEIDSKIQKALDNPLAK